MNFQFLFFRFSSKFITRCVSPPAQGKVLMYEVLRIGRVFLHDHSSTATVKTVAFSPAVDIAHAHKSCSPPQLVLGLDIETSDWDEPLTFAKESLRVACSYLSVSCCFRYKVNFIFLQASCSHLKRHVDNSLK